MQNGPHKRKHTRRSGVPFELEVYHWLKELLASGDLGLLPANTKVYHRRSYYSSARGSDIVFDVAIEMTVPGTSAPAFIWIWECKDYTSPVPVDDVEEFHAKLNQVGANNTKGTIISSGSFQVGAFNFAQSQKIGLVRFMPAGQVEWVIPRRNQSGNEPPGSSISITEQALTISSFMARNQQWFGFTSGGATCRHLRLESFLGLQLREWDVR